MWTDSSIKTAMLVVGLALAVATPPSLANALDQRLIVQTPGLARQLILHKGWAYVADGNSGLSYVEFRADALNLHSTQLANASNAVDLDMSESILYVADYNFGLLILDISSQPPIEVSRISLPGNTAGVASSGDKCAVASRKAGVAIVGTNKDGQFMLQSQVDLPDVHDVAIIKDTIFAADIMEGLVVINAENVNAPHVQSTTELPCLEPSVGHCAPIAIAVHNSLAYLGTGEGVAIFNISNPDSPLYLETLAAGVVGELIIVNETLYIQNYDEGVDLITGYKLSNSGGPEFSFRCSLKLEPLVNASLSFTNQQLYLLADDVYKAQLDGAKCDEQNGPHNKPVNPTAEPSRSWHQEPDAQ